jgi:predicted small metal-binding protein
MEDAVITVRCVCGWETTGPEAVAVAATVEHGRRLHNMTATRDEVLAMAVASASEGAITQPDPDGR